MNNFKKTILFISLILVLLFGTTIISAVDDNTTTQTSTDITSTDVSKYTTNTDIINEKNVKKNDNIKTQQKENKIITKNKTTPKKSENDKYIYVSSNGNTNSDGLDISNPTTIKKALTDVYNNTIIYFITDTDEDIYNFTRPINVTTVSKNITFTLKGEKNKKIIFDGGNQTGFLNFGEGNNITISNIEFRNSKTESLIFARNNTIKLDNLTFTANTLEIKDITKMQELANILDLSYSDIIINNTIFEGNFAKNLSSLVVARNSSNFIMSNSIFERNLGVDLAKGIFLKSSRSTFENNTFYNNEFRNESLIVLSYSKTDFISNKFDKNYANVDGCINILLSEIYFEGNEFTNNKAKNGGVLFIENSGCNIINSTFIANNASYSGGAIVFLAGELNISKCIFIQNTAGYEGGAINSRQADMKISNSTFTDNKAIRGGALYITYNDDTEFSEIHSSIFKNNKANNGSAVYSSDNINLTYNSITSNMTTNMFYSIYNQSYCINNNWWGSNNPDFNQITNTIRPNNWVIIRSSNKTLENNTQQIIVKLIHENQKTMAECDVTFITSTGRFDQKTMKIKDTITNYYSGNSNDCIIKLDDEKINITQKVDPQIYADNITCNAGENIKISIQMSNDTKANTTIKFDNITLYNGKIENGTLNITYKIDPKYAQSKHNLTITYLGDNFYNMKTILKQVTVRINETKQNTTITPLKTGNTTNQTNTTNETLPDKYDLRDFGQVTPVKDQGADGNCWSFASIAALESAILKKYNITTDFSEDHMKNLLNKYSFMGNPFKEPNKGDSYISAMGYYLGWYGPINETEEPYVGSSLISPLMNSTFHIQDVIFLDTIDTIKKAIMNYGGVATLIFAGDDPLNLYNIKDDSNHAITLIGWDDNYSRYNFKAENEKGEIVNPAGDGAFILKNSWGTDTGDNGYQYISFYDKTFSADSTFACTIILDENKNYENIYQYDTVVFPNDTMVDLNKDFKNIYTAQRNETIAAVGNFFDKDTNYTIEVYVNNVLKTTQKGTTNRDGFITIQLENYVPVNKDDIFTVIMKTTSKNPSGAWVQNPLYKASNKENQSFIKIGNGEWVDLHDTQLASSLKAYTKTTPILTTYVNKTENQLIIETNITTQTPGKLVFKANGVTLKDKNGTVIKYSINSSTTIKLAYDLEYNKKQLNFTVVFTTDDYKIVQQKDVQLLGNKIIMKIDPIHACIDDEVQLNVTITDINGNNITGGKVAFKANGVTLKDAQGNVLYAKLVDGKASITYKIPASWKNVIITVTYSGTNKYEEGRINTTDINVVYRNITAKITPIPSAESGETITITTTLSDKTINTGRAVYKINGVTIKDTQGNPIYLTPKNGVISIKYTIPKNFSAKKYNISIVFSNKNYSNITATQTLTVKKSTKQSTNLKYAKTKNEIKIRE